MSIMIRDSRMRVAHCAKKCIGYVSVITLQRCICTITIVILLRNPESNISDMYQE